MRRSLMAIEIQPSLAPHLVVDDAAAAIDFYVKAFDAVEHGRVPGPDGRLIHAALNINGFTVLLNDDFPEHRGGKSMTPNALGGTPVTIHLTVTDVDAKFQKAVDAGATGSPRSRTSSGATATASCVTRSAITGQWGNRYARSASMKSRRR
jgi:uncharacterized glyoxalase superfamily protein PhnB